jgi:Histidine kinase-, DNA gyrase B-, and HSP90-like ATPase.
MIESINQLSANLDRIIICFDSSITIYFMLQLLSKLFPVSQRLLKKFPYPLTIGYSILTGLLLTYCIYQLRLERTTMLLLTMAVGILFILIFLKGDNYPATIIVVSYCIISIILRFILITLYALTTQSRLGNILPYENFILHILTLSCIYLAARYIFVLTKQLPSKIPIYYWVILLIMLIGIYISIVLLEDTFLSESSFQILGIEFFILTLTLLIYYLFVKIAKDYENSLKIRLNLMEVELNLRHINETKELYQKLRMLRHELKNQIFYMKMLLDEQDFEKLEAYLEKMIHNPDVIDNFYDTGNITVNSIINFKIADARSHNIAVTLNASLPDKLTMDTGDLYSLISNMMDNAIEHIDSQNPHILIDFKIVKAYLSITVRNTISFPVLASNPGLNTSKTDKEFHGFGIKVMRSIVSKYDGTIDFHCEDGYFICSALLPQ